MSQVGRFAYDEALVSAIVFRSVTLRWMLDPVVEIVPTLFIWNWKDQVTLRADERVDGDILEHSFDPLRKQVRSLSTHRKRLRKEKKARSGVQ